MFYKGCKNTYWFTKYKTICAFSNAIKNGIISMHVENEEQNQLLKPIAEFKSKTRPSDPKTKN